MWLSLCPCSGVYNPPEGPVVVGRLSNKQIVVDVASDSQSLINRSSWQRVNWHIAAARKVESR